MSHQGTLGHKELVKYEQMRAYLKSIEGKLDGEETALSNLPFENPTRKDYNLARRLYTRYASAEEERDLGENSDIRWDFII